MAVDYKPLNRNQEFSTPQKAAIKKIFGFAEAAASGGDSTLVSREIVHTTMAGNFPANIERDLRALCKEFRSATDAADNARDIDSVVSVMTMPVSCKKVIRTMANAVIAQVV